MKQNFRISHNDHTSVPCSVINLYQKKLLCSLNPRMTIQRNCGPVRQFK